MSLVLQSSGGGQITIQEPATASNFTQTLPAASGEVMVSGNQPAFRAYQTSTQNYTSAVATKVLFPTEEFDTNSNFASSRFTPTVAGYYQINSSIFVGGTTTLTSAFIQAFKNGLLGTSGLSFQNGFGITANVGLTYSDIFYCNGTTDYLEIYATVTGTGTLVSSTGIFSGCLVRNA
jgi:hypothetical protein